MPQYKLTLVFNQGRTGWTETWYAFKSNTEIMMTALKNVATYRQRLLGAGASIEYLRVSDVAILQDSTVQPITSWGSNSAPPSADQPWNAVYCRCEATDMYRRQVWLRGLPDEWIDPAGDNPASPAVNPPYNRPLLQFQNALINNGFQLRVINKEGSAGANTAITGISAGDAGRTRLAVGTAPGAVGDEFRVSQFTGPDKALLNGVKKIAGAGAGYVEIATPFSSLTAPASNVGGKSKPRQIAYREVTSLQAIRTAKRSTGRAFFLPVGRRKRAK